MSMLNARTHFPSIPEYTVGKPLPSLDMPTRGATAFESALEYEAPSSSGQLPAQPPNAPARRHSSIFAPQSKALPAPSSRRSSSVYSQWGRDDVSWHSSDFADEPLPQLPTLQPLAYSASTPQLSEVQSTLPFLQSRTYSPLLATPTPTASQPTTPLCEGSVEDFAYTPEKGKNLPGGSCAPLAIPLHEAIMEVHAPGAVHLLPEEHREKTAGRSRSQAPMDTMSAHTGSGRALGGPSEPLVLIDHQGRPRSIIRGKESLAPTDDHALRSVRPIDMPHPSATTRKEVRQGDRTLVEQLSPGKRAVPAWEDHDFEEQRGRTLQRVPKIPGGRGVAPGKLPFQAQPDAQAIANEYHSILPQQRPVGSIPPRLHTADSDDSIRAHMRMIPSPLFQTKSPPKSSENAIRFDNSTLASSYNLSMHSGIPSKPASTEPIEYFPSAYSLSGGRTHKRMSTSGSIPISPPTDHNTRFSPPSKEAATRTNAKSAKSGQPKYSSRKSAFYPHIAPRKAKTSRARDRARTANDRNGPSGNDQSSNATDRKKPTPFKIKPTTAALDDVRRSSSGSSDKAHQPLYQRIANGAAKYADLLTRPELPDRTDYEAMTTATVTSGSPHLTPVSPSSDSKEVHLGWSDTAKSKFDKAISPASVVSRPKMYTHVVTPARPLDESKQGLKDAGAPRRKSSVFASLIDSWKESKAEKRRQDLKKTIKVLPHAEESAPRKGRRRSSGSFGWM